MKNKKGIACKIFKECPMTDIFKNKTPDFQKLLKFGFIKENDLYTYKALIDDSQMTLSVTIDKEKNIKTKITDNDFGEEYVLHLMPENTGEYVGKIRSAYQEILQRIADNCFQTEIFKSPQAKEIISYINQKYSDNPEYLWPKFPNNAIWRRADNKKWYAVILTVSAERLGFENQDTLEILDLRVKEKELENLIDGQKYFPAYHMNKKHWLTVCLNDSLSSDIIKHRIDESYLLALKK